MVVSSGGVGGIRCLVDGKSRSGREQRDVDEATGLGVD